MSLRQRLLARCYDRFTSSYEAWMAERTQALLGDLVGTVLEIGPGTGANFRYLPAGIRWIGIEPNRFMHPRLRQRAAERGIEADFRVASAELLDLGTGSVDAVVSTLVLCSVDDPSRVLAEIHRVLRPDGRFAFLEHVAAPAGTWLRRWQKIIKPVWCFIGDGCHTDRETGALIARAGFRSVEIDEFRVPWPPAPAWVAPHIAGVAVK
jgi:SAM-dependent methyltransferase